MTRNVARVLILVWMAVALRAGLVTWHDHAVPVTVQGATSLANPSGLIAVDADVACPAVIGGDGSPELVDDLSAFGTVEGPQREPCRPYLRGRQALFFVDLAAGIGALALTFAHLPRQWRERRVDAAATVAA